MSSQLDALKSWMLRQASKKLSIELERDDEPLTAGRKEDETVHHGCDDEDEKNADRTDDDKSVDYSYNWIPNRSMTNS